jgi:hypothetical protein
MYLSLHARRVRRPAKINTDTSPGPEWKSALSVAESKINSGLYQLDQKIGAGFPNPQIHTWLTKDSLLVVMPELVLASIMRAWQCLHNRSTLSR